MPRRILVVDDEEDILELLRYNLVKEGFIVKTTPSGEEALRAARELLPDLIVLDLMLPGLDGLEVCRRLKGDSATAAIPIMMLTAKSEDPDIVAGLELGADDYVTKPFSPRVLVARVRALLRRQPRPAAAVGRDVLAYHELHIDPPRHLVRVLDKSVDLTATEFAILHFLVSRPGWVFTRNQIIEGVKGDDYPVTDRSVDVQIVSLRRKLSESGAVNEAGVPIEAGAYIETVRGVGYRFKE